ncbi:MAG: type I 3-dehydroquinate dehydratase [Candidatus Heimdallarchaeota archaeon]
MNPKICGVITVNSVQEAYSVIMTPQTKNCDLIELRLDYLEILEMKELAKLLEELQIPSILTLRSQQEGGKFVNSEEQRLQDLKKLIQLQPDYVDLEMHIEEEHLCSLMTSAKSKKVKTILSSHFFENTPTTQDLTERLEFGKEQEADVVKVITFAKRIGDNDTVLALNKVGQDLGIDTVAFCMGSLGLPSRMLCVYWGAAFTYASLNEQSASGQLSTSVLGKFYALLQERCKTWK